MKALGLQPAARVLLTAPLTLYVTTTGSDAIGDGSIGNPFRQVQRALTALERYDIRAAAVISVGAGSFEAYAVDGARLQISSAYGPGQTGGSLTISGTAQAPTLTTGTTTGTLSAASAVVDGSTVITDSTQAWTPAELVGKLVTVGASTYVITENAATTARLATTTLPASGSAYAILVPGTLIDSGTALSAGSAAGARIVLAGGLAPLQAAVTIEWQQLSLDGSTGLITRQFNGTVRYCRFVRTSGTSVAVVGTGSTNVTITFCFSDLQGTSGVHVTRSTSQGQMLITGCLLRGGSAGISAGLAADSIVAATCEFNTVVTGVVLGGANTAWQHSGCRFVGCTTAISQASTLSGNLSSISSGSLASHFASCGTILSFSGSGSAGLGNCTGSGNTLGIVASKGAHVQIGATATLGTSGAEITVDGATTTLATMRALVPKAYPAAPNAYGTVVYE